MSKEQTLESTSGAARSPAQDAESSAANSGQGMVGDIASTLGNHKGKLAIGAAAMLGLAVFYKWRENRLARDNPDEYARLRRLKAAVEANGTPRPGARKG